MKTPSIATIDRISHEVISAAIEVHRELGPGLINFNVAVLKSGIRRRILGYETEQATLPEETHHDH
jgi:hypothetical protein